MRKILTLLFILLITISISSCKTRIYPVTDVKIFSKFLSSSPTENVIPVESVIPTESPSPTTSPSI